MSAIPEQAGETVPCPKCGTDHEGYENGSWGAEVRCLRLQAEALGAGHLVDQVDALEHDRLVRLDCALFGGDAR